MNEVVQETQQPASPAVPAAPASPSVEPSAKPEQQVGSEGTEKKVEAEETPQRRESRRARQLNRERERRIAAETELRLLRESREKEQQAKQPQSPEGAEPSREQFQSYEEFIEARATWRAQKAAAEETRKILEESRKKDTEARSRSEDESRVKEWNAKLDKARDEIEDFDEVCAESEAVVTPAMSTAILESDKGAQIAYFLAKNPDEAERISKLSPSKQAAAIVSLEEKVAKPAKQPSKAPEPINPVGTKVEVEKDPSKMSDAEFNAWRRRQIAQRR